MTHDIPADVDNSDNGAGPSHSPAERIRDLNDELRVTGTGGQVMLTRSLIAKGQEFVAKACAAVRDFDAFTNDNDPWQEHDCAVLEIDGERIMFKIDYYDKNLEFGSPDPADPRLTRRVLTIMLASDY